MTFMFHYLPPRCVITGCALLRQGSWVAGDLFDADTHWVFNGNIRNGAAIAWQPAAPVPHYQKHITLEGEYFERRGVFVVHKSAATLNPAAIDYIS